MRIIKILSRAIVLLGVPLFAFAANTGDIVITEIAYDLKDADSGHEWVELYNTATSSVDLTGWKFSDGSNHLLNAPPKNGGQGSLVLPAGGFAVLADDAAVFLTDHPGFAGTVIDTVMSLNNTQATLSLLDASGLSLDTVAYSKDWGAAGNGKTLERTDMIFPTDAAHWKESIQDGGTPGARNSAMAPAGTSDSQQQSATSTAPAVDNRQIPSTAGASPLHADAGDNIVGRANEDIFFEGFGTGGVGGTLSFTWNFGDGTIEKKVNILHRYQFPGTYIATLTVSNGTQQSEDQIEVRIFSDAVAISEFMPNPQEGGNEWIELSNSADYGADISGWGLGTAKEKPAYLIPGNTFLAHNGFLVFPQSTTHLALSDTKSSLFLFYPNGRVAGEVAYENPKRGFSAASKNGAQFFWTSEQTPGMKNVFIETTARGNTGAAASVEEEKSAGKNVTYTPSFAVYEKQSGIKSFLGQPAYAAVASDAAPAASQDSPRENGSASILTAFSGTSFLALAGILGIAWIGLRYLRKEN